MVRKLDRRVAFYTKKVAELYAIHPSKALPARYKYRSSRLFLYKALLHQQIEEAGYKR
ncbi:hypothetical protein BN1002_02996 [Bacillus sp. B-jedd]|nr:hypothetical protein BN1002_02996 [Bacillus sp. B-jedd]